MCARVCGTISRLPPNEVPKKVTDIYGRTPTVILSGEKKTGTIFSFRANSIYDARTTCNDRPVRGRRIGHVRGLDHENGKNDDGNNAKPAGTVVASTRYA